VVAHPPSNSAVSAMPAAIKRFIRFLSNFFTVFA